MIENLSAYVSWIFVFTTFLTVAFYLYAVRSASQRGYAVPITDAALSVLMIVQAWLAYSGFYLTNTMPPRFVLGPFPTIVVLLALFFAFAPREGISIKSLRVLTLLSIMRVPVEMVLLWLYQHGQVPELMTFEGRNFDIISGITAPVVAWLGFRGGKVNRPLLIAWNLLALGLLVNIVMISTLSLETPFQRFAFDQPNRGVLYFPFIWLPSIIVPIVLVTHIVSLWHLVNRRKLTAE